MVRKTGNGVDYTVGYRRPPKGSQFKPGISGNPKGRPKGSRPIGALLLDIIEQKIAVTESGKIRHLPVQEIIFRRLVSDAMRGNQPAIKLVLSLLEHYAASPQTKIQLGELLVEDKEILAQYLHEDADTNHRASHTVHEKFEDDK